MEAVCIGQPSGCTQTISHAPHFVYPKPGQGQKQHLGRDHINHVWVINMFNTCCVPDPNLTSNLQSLRIDSQVNEQIRDSLGDLIYSGKFGGSIFWRKGCLAACKGDGVCLA